MAAGGWMAVGRLRAVSLILVSLTALPAFAQAVSQGRGSLLFTVGRGAGPVGGIATNIVAGANVARESTLHATGFRIGGGYQFADYFAAEVTLAHIGTLRSRAPFPPPPTETLAAETEFTAIEAQLVARIPLADNVRLDLGAGAAATGLRTTLRTAQGSALPPEPGTLNARRAGPTVGADVEWRLGESTSLIVGYHLYSHVGSSTIVGLASGNMTLIAAGLRLEF